MNNVESLLGDARLFLEKIFTSLKIDNIDIFNFELDHICYRVETYDKYSYLKNELSNFGTLISENKINGRLISNFKLLKPIVFQKWKIWLLELPAPKEGNPYPEGYEHVEFATGIDPKEFMKLYPKIQFNKGGLLKDVNSDVTIEYKGFVVKFHKFPLEYVIKNFK